MATSLIFASFNDAILNGWTALLERVFYHNKNGVFTRPHVPAKGVVGRLLLTFGRRLKGMLPSATPVGRMKFPEAYSGRKRLVYLRAAQRVDASGFRDTYAYLDTFLKHEKIAVLDKRAVPRVIQPRRPEYNVEVGRYLRHLEHAIYRRIGTIWGGPTVMKGYNAYEQGRIFHEAWRSYSNPMAVGLDASRFDQHVNVPLLEWEHDVYQHCYPGDKYLRRLLKLQLVNRGFMRCRDGMIEYSNAGGRCSGDMNTALGNCLLMCAMVYSLLERRELVGHQHPRVRLMNNGDDCVLIGERDDIISLLPSVQPHFEQFGIEMKVERPVQVLEEVEFCQTRPVDDGVVWRMVRDPRVSCSKDATILDYQYAFITPDTHMKGLGLCGLALTAGLPVLQEYYLALIRGRETITPANDQRLLESGMYQLSRGLTFGGAITVTETARLSFMRAFGVCPSSQVALESAYREVTIGKGPVQPYAEWFNWI